MHRLRAFAKEEEDLNSLAVIAGECVKLINVYFSPTSHLPEVREAELAIINESLQHIRNETENENTVQERNENENEKGSTEEHCADPKEKDGEENVEGAVGGNRVTVESESSKLAAEVAKLTAVVGVLLQRITVLEANQTSSQPVDTHAKTTNSTRIEEQVNDDRESVQVQENPVDFLAWLKKRNDSLDTLGVSENVKKVGRTVVEKSQNVVGKSRSENRFPIHKWAVKYDGMDNGRKLNEFLKEVDFNARSEGFSEAELFQGAHHLFTQKARSWYMEVCSEIGSWRELVKELKREFLPVDIDYVYERQAGNRKQGAREKFQDFYLDMVRIFRSMSTPWDEKRKFDVLFRNTREDCRIAMLAANIDSIPKMRDFGKRFDSINWHMYQKREGRFTRKDTIQIDEVSQQSSYRENRERYHKGDQHKGAPNAYQSFRSNNQPSQKREWRPQQHQHKITEQKEHREKTCPKPRPNNSPHRNSVPSTSGTNALERIVRAYIPLKKNVCFNCHEGGHSFNECNQERKLFCERCGFPGFQTKDCPYCQSKNGQKTV